MNNRTAAQVDLLNGGILKSLFYFSLPILISYVFLQLYNTVDILIVGSIASFNWSKYSDIDLHIITDFKAINDNTELVKNYLYSKSFSPLSFNLPR